MDKEVSIDYDKYDTCTAYSVRKLAITFTHSSFVSRNVVETVNICYYIF